jgi:6-phosphogluconolactonase
MHIKTAIQARTLLACLALLVVGACGGGIGVPGKLFSWAPPTTYTLGGTITGMVGSGLTLADNGSAFASIEYPADGSYPSLLGEYLPGTTYNVTVATQPTNPSQTCVIAHGAGTVGGANVTDIAITCTTNHYTLGGTVMGLTGSGLVLSDAGGEHLAVNASGPFQFKTSVPSGSTYAVTIAAQPNSPAQRCMVLNGTGTGTVGAANVTTASIVCASPASHVYIAGQAPDLVAGYAVDATNGVLGGIPGSPFAAGAHPSSIASDPSGHFIYAVNSGAGTVSGYAVAAGTGALAPLPGSPYAAVADAIAISTDPAGRYAYVAAGPPASPEVAVLAMDAGTGALSPVAGSPFVAANAGAALAITIDPRGRFGYLTYTDGSTATSKVAAMTVNVASGALASVVGNPFAGATGGTQPVSAIDPTGRFLYVATSDSGTVTAYAIDATSGALTAVPNGTAASGGNSVSSLAVDASGLFLYAATTGVAAFKIDGASGALTLVPGSPFGAACPVAIAPDPSGEFLYAVAGCGAGGAVSVYAIAGATGALSAVPGSPFTGPGNAPTAITIAR